jgi:hypothetical protein
MTDPRHDLDELAARLERERPDLSPAAYERVHERVVGTVPQRRRASRASIAATLTIAIGILFTGGGASLAISGLASDTTAVRAQYAPTVTTVVTPPTTPSPGPQVGIQGTTETAAPDDDAAAQGVTDEEEPTLGDTQGEAVADEQAAQAPVQVQVAAEDDELPFTGFAAIPIVLAGALLIAIGAILRRRTG